MGKSNLVDLDMQILRETEKAVLATLDVPDNGVWLPKSQIEIQDTVIEGIVSIALPEWLAKDKGLI